MHRFVVFKLRQVRTIG